MVNSDLMSVLLPLFAVLLAAGLAIAWVVRPLHSAQAPAPPPVDDRLAALQARKEAVLTAIRELDFDHKTGKLTEEDFARHDARLRRQAIALLQQIEQVAPAASMDEDALEAEIAQRRKQLDTVTDDASHDATGSNS